MDPIHLKEEELAYELMIRGVYDPLDNNTRSRGAKLRELLSKENRGIAQTPDDRPSPYPPSDELRRCVDTIQEIIEATATENVDPSALSTLYSRAIHVGMRLQRIHSLDPNVVAMKAAKIEQIERIIHELQEEVDKPKKIRQRRSTIATDTAENVTPGSQRQNDTILSTLSEQPHVSAAQQAIRNLHDMSGVETRILANTAPPTTSSVTFNPAPINFGDIEPDRRSTASGATLRIPTAPVPPPTHTNRLDESFEQMLNVNPYQHNQFRNNWVEPNLNSNLRNIAVRPAPIAPPIYPHNRILNTQAIFPNSYQETTANSLRDESYDFPSARTNENAQYENDEHTYTLAYRPVGATHNRIPPPPYNTQQHNDFHTLILNQTAPNVNLRVPARENINNASLPTARPARSNVPLDQRYLARYSHFKPIPVDKWQIFFSGDRPMKTNELSIHQWIENIEMYTKSNCMHPDDVTIQIGHLLKGTARLWYPSIRNSILDWEDFVAKLKAHFLSESIYAEVMSEIDGRKQGENESVSTYIAEISAMYRSIPIDLPESLKCYTIKKNLRVSIYRSLLSTAFTSIASLETAARNVELGLSVLPNNNFRQNAKPRGNVSALEESEIIENLDVSETIPASNESELAEAINAIVSKFTNRNNNTSARPNVARARNSDGKSLCFNCRETGHLFKECKKEQSHIFCFRCGELNVITPTCPKCNAAKKSDLSKDKPNQQ